MANVKGRLAKLEAARPQREAVPEILESDTPEEASKKYKQLVGMRGQLHKAPAEVIEMTQEEASEMYYAAVPHARRPVVVNEPAPPVKSVDDGDGDGYEWLDGYEEWQAAHPGQLFADRGVIQLPQTEEHNEQPEPPPLVALPAEPISDDDNWLII